MVKMSNVQKHGHNTHKLEGKLIRIILQYLFMIITSYILEVNDTQCVFQSFVTN